MDNLLYLKKRLESMQQELDTLNDTIKSVDFRSSIRGRRDSSPVERATAKREKVQKAIESINQEIDTEKSRRLDIIAGLETSYDRMMFFWKYVELLTDKQIGEKIGKSVNAVYRYFYRQYKSIINQV